MRRLILAVLAPAALLATLAIEPAAAAPLSKASPKADSIGIEAAIRGGRARGVAVRGRGFYGRGAVVAGRRGIYGGRAVYARGGGIYGGRRFYAGGAYAGPYYGGGGYYAPGYVYGGRAIVGGRGFYRGGAVAGRGFYRGGAVAVGRRGFAGGRRYAGRVGGGFRRR